MVPERFRVGLVEGATLRRCPCILRRGGFAILHARRCARWDGSAELCKDKAMPRRFLFSNHRPAISQCSIHCQSCNQTHRSQLAFCEIVMLKLAFREYSAQRAGGFCKKRANGDGWYVQMKFSFCT